MPGLFKILARVVEVVALVVVIGLTSGNEQQLGPNFNPLSACVCLPQTLGQEEKVDETKIPARIEIRFRFRTDSFGEKLEAENWKYLKGKVSLSLVSILSISLTSVFFQKICSLENRHPHGS